MRPLILSTHDLFGGAARAAYRLHRGLCDHGIDSRMLVQYAKSKDPSILRPESKYDIAMSYIWPSIEKFITPSTQQRLFSPAWVPNGTVKNIFQSGADIIHLNWISSAFVSIKSLKKLAYPIVWTLHDMWPFTGGCHYDSDCGKYREICHHCPQLRPTPPIDLARKVFQNKISAWKDLNLTIVSPSQWLAKEAGKSTLFKDRRIEVIPNGLDIGLYKPIEKKEARSIMGIPLDKKIILFGAMGATSDKRKGYLQLKHAIESLSHTKLKHEIEIMIFGEDKTGLFQLFGFPVHYTGKLYDDISLAILYSSADVYVAPSLQENLSCTVMESLACGTPCVAFNIGGMPDMIKHKVNGYLSIPFDTNDLANGIEWVLNNNIDNSQSINARNTACKNYNIDNISQKYIDLYRDLLA